MQLRPDSTFSLLMCLVDAAFDGTGAIPEGWGRGDKTEVVTKLSWWRSYHGNVYRDDATDDPTLGNDPSDETIQKMDALWVWCNGLLEDEFVSLSRADGSSSSS